MNESNESDKQPLPIILGWGLAALFLILSIVLFAQNRSLRSAPSAGEPKDGEEIARLREEVRSLRQRLGDASGGSVGLDKGISPATIARGLEAGDTNALTMMKSMEELPRNAAPILALLGRHAIEGEDKAVVALWRVGKDSKLGPQAVEWLGKAARAGNDQALNLLADAQQFGLPTDRAVVALKEAADTGNDKAIAALAAIVKDPARKDLWPSATAGLQKAADAGKGPALQALGREEKQKSEARNPKSEEKSEPAKSGDATGHEATKERAKPGSEKVE
jgi:TPR repeat protein